MELLDNDLQQGECKSLHKRILKKEPMFTNTFNDNNFLIANSYILHVSYVSSVL